MRWRKRKYMFRLEVHAAVRKGKFRAVGNGSFRRQNRGVRYVSASAGTILWRKRKNVCVLKEKRLFKKIYEGKTNMSEKRKIMFL